MAIDKKNRLAARIAALEGKLVAAQREATHLIDYDTECKTMYDTESQTKYKAAKDRPHRSSTRPLTDRSTGRSPMRSTRPTICPPRR